MPERPNNLLLKARIHTTLIAAGISQHKFAVFADMSPHTLSRYLAGQTWSATTERKLERALVRLPRRKSPKHRRVRLCKTCGTDISDRNGNARQCSDCDYAAWEAGKHRGANHGKA